MLLNFYFQAHTQENLGLEMSWGAHLHSQFWRPSQNIVTALVPQGPGTAKACCVPVLLGFIKNRSNRTFKIYSPSWGKHSLHPRLRRMAELHPVATSAQSPPWSDRDLKLPFSLRGTFFSLFCGGSSLFFPQSPLTYVFRIWDVFLGDKHS